MQIRMNFKQLQSSDSVKNYAEEKSTKLKKYFNGKINVDWFFSVERNDQIAEIKVSGRDFTYVGESKSEDLYFSIDLALDKVETQVRKRKEKVVGHK